MQQVQSLLTPLGVSNEQLEEVYAVLRKAHCSTASMQVRTVPQHFATFSHISKRCAPACTHKVLVIIRARDITCIIKLYLNSSTILLITVDG